MLHTKKKYQKFCNKKMLDASYTILFEKLEKTFFHNSVLLNQIDIQINTGEFLFLTGVSGTGKTTLFKMILGDEAPTSGKIYYNGLDISLIPKTFLPFYRREIGMVYQDYRLLINETVKQNISIPLKINKTSSSKIAERIKQVAKQFSLTKLLNHKVKTLSGGERQLVAIARATIHKPKILLADEPTANLDYSMGMKIFRRLRRINQQGTTVIVATHNIELMKAFKSRILLIKNKSIVEVQPK